MKKKQTKPKEIERVHDDAGIPTNVDFVEISMTNEGLEKLAQKNSPLLDQRNDPVLRKHTVRRQEKLLRKTFKAASHVLTDAQFQIFTMRYVYQLPEEEIAQQVGCVQNYISRALKASIKKIQKRLRVPINLKGFTKDRKSKHDKE
ncbi:MAG: sigma factor-like helix-turn-helix DNA-binding protein [bacterium]